MFLLWIKHCSTLRLRIRYTLCVRLDMSKMCVSVLYSDSNLSRLIIRLRFEATRIVPSRLRTFHPNERPICGITSAWATISPIWEIVPRRLLYPLCRIRCKDYEVHASGYGFYLNQWRAHADWDYCNSIRVAQWFESQVTAIRRPIGTYPRYLLTSIRSFSKTDVPYP